MEHEDNAQLDNYLQNRLTESLQIAGGAGDVADVAGELVPNIGAKSGEHEDDEEWKYIKEGQQSEKQQQQQHEQQRHEQFYAEMLDGDDADVGITFGVGNNVVAGNGIGIGAVDMNFVVGNGNGHANIGDDAFLSIRNGGDSDATPFLGFDEEDVEIIKNDGDFSTNSNTTTSTGEVEPVQVAAQLDAHVQQQEQPAIAAEQLQQEQHHDDEEEASSVATTYGTSSLSENNGTPLEQDAELLVEQESQQLQQQEQNNLPAQEDFSFEHFDDKENANPIDIMQQRPIDLVGLEEPHSQLNPNAVEFVPSFGSQPTSPIERESVVMGINVRQLMAVAVDDLVAESPRKGVRDCNMDIIAVPDELEFDNEAAKRPHELEQEDDDMFGDGVQPAVSGEVVPHEQLLNGAGATTVAAVEDVLDYQRIDHGPETSVDLDVDVEPLALSATAVAIDAAADIADIMKQSIYAEHSSSIEDILNSVQPLPTQGDEQEQQQMLDEQAGVGVAPLDFDCIGAAKELLYVEEKEHVSQSPSTEELHDQLFDTPRQQLPPAEDPMQASFYLEHTSSDAQQLAESVEQFAEHIGDQSLLLNTSEPGFSPLDESLLTTTHDATTKLELAPEIAAVVDITPSPLSSTEEKHLVEDTKEQVLEALPSMPVQEEQEPFLLSDNIEPVYTGASPQVEHADFSAATGNEIYNNDEQQTVASNPFADVQQLEPVVEHKEVQQEVEVQQELQQETHAYYNDTMPEAQPPAQESATELVKQLAVDVIAELEADSFANGHNIELSITPPPVEAIETGVEPAVEASVEAVAEPAPLAAAAEPLPVAELAVAGTAAVAAAAAVAVVAAAKPKIKSSPAESAAKKPAPKTGLTAAKPKPATTAAAAAKKPTTSSTAAAKPAAPRPRTAPAAAAATKTSASTTAAAAKPATTARKPLVSSSLGAAKPAPRTILSSTRPATAPTSKPAGSSLTKTTTTTTTSAARTLAAARKPASSATNGTAQLKPRLGATTTAAAATAASKPSSLSVGAAAAAKPKLSPRSTLSSQLRKTSPGSAGARSPTKPLANGVTKSSTTTTTTTTRVKSASANGSSGGGAATTTTTTTVKTFTARPAPKFTHSLTTTTSSSTARRTPLTTSSASPNAAAPRRSSPLKPASTSTVKLSPLKPNNTTPLKLKAKEPIKSSPIGLKGKKPISGTTAAKPDTANVEAVAIAGTAVTNGDAKLEHTEAPINQNGNGVHAAAIEVAEFELQPPTQAADVALLDF